MRREKCRSSEVREKYKKGTRKREEIECESE